MRLTAEHVSQFHREGYLLVEDVLSDADLQPVIDEIAAHLDQQAAELVAAGELSQAYAAESFATRLIPITAETVAPQGTVDERIGCRIGGLCTTLADA